MFGSHLSIAGGLHNALDAARALGMECVQIFTQNQRQWANRRLTAAEIRRWRDSRDAAALRAIVSHGSYLVNLAATDATVRRKSAAALREELKRCGRLGVDLLVVHPGAHMGAGEEAGVARATRSIDRAMTGLEEVRTVLCLETTAGMGTALGSTVEQLRRIIDASDHADRLGVCLDTAHMLAAGYDLTGPAGARTTMNRCRRVLGAGRIRAVHVNDSKTSRASRVDRHEHIGRGRIPLEAFAELANDRTLRSVPKILETPKGKAPDGRDWDAINLEALRRLVRPRPERR